MWFGWDQLVVMGKVQRMAVMAPDLAGGGSHTVTGEESVT